MVINPAALDLPRALVEWVTTSMVRLTQDLQQSRGALGVQADHRGGVGVRGPDGDAEGGSDQGQRLVLPGAVTERAGSGSTGGERCALDSYAFRTLPTRTPRGSPGAQASGGR